MTSPPCAVLIERAHATIVAAEPELVGLRRHLHQHPELSRQEFETTRLLIERLEGLGFEVHPWTGGVGLYADLAPSGFDPESMPTIAMRADIDALSILEDTGLPFASSNVGVMHACGHDMHTTIGMGVAVGLSAIRERLPGRFRLIYQHSEEVAPGGAKDLVAFGAMDGVSSILALHVDPELPVGEVGLKSGPLTAASDAFTLTILGKSGHGARPHQAIDPVFISSLVIQELYRAPAHHFDVRDPVVISVGTINGGHMVNIIPERVTLTGTVRTLSKAHREAIEPLFDRLAAGICGTHGASYLLEMQRGSPSIYNDPGVTGVVEEVCGALLGADKIHQIPLPSMGAEDYSEFLERAPGMMLRLGVWDGGAKHFLHSSHFTPSEDALVLGARIMSQSILRLMSN